MTLNFNVHVSLVKYFALTESPDLIAKSHVCYEFLGIIIF